MAWSSIPLSAHTDTPTFVARNAVRKTVNPLDARWCTAGTFAGTDITASGYAVNFAFDGHLTVDTRPSAANAVVFLVLRVDILRPFSWIVLGHNFEGLTTAPLVRLETADSDDFATNLQTIHNFGSVDQVKRLSVALGSLWSSVERVRLRIEVNLGTDPGWIPNVTELFLGTRYVLEHGPIDGFDGAGRVDGTKVQRARSGQLSTYVDGQGGRQENFRYRIGADTDRDTLRALHAATNHGVDPMFFVDAPNTTPEDAYLVGPMGPLQLPGQGGPVHRTWQYNLLESAPFLALEV